MTVNRSFSYRVEKSIKREVVLNGSEFQLSRLLNELIYSQILPVIFHYLMMTFLYFMN